MVVVDSATGRGNVGEAMAIDVDDVKAALGAIVTPDGSRLDAGTALGGVTAKDDRVTVVLQIPDAAAAVRWEPVRRELQRVAEGVTGVASALVIVTAERIAEQGQTATTSNAPRASASAGRLPSLAQVKRVIAVASGKGGVGKSTTAVNLALSLKARGLAVGFMDADVHGPSGPKLFGLKGQPRIISGRTIAPLDGYGCKVMSIGFLVEPEKAMIWRGPMVSSAITQMLRDVAWGALDVLVVDMPPGTGDAQLTLAQTVPLDGAVIVSTPQDLALIDARRGIAMFRDVGVPILGLIENMSYFVCDSCGKHHHIFAHGGAKAEATRLDVPFLGAIPLDLALRERSDMGLPIAVADPDGDIGQRYGAIASQVARDLKIY